MLQVPFDQLQKKYNTEALAGGGPNVLLGPPDWLGGYVEAEVALPIDEELAETDFAAGYNPTSIGGLTYDGSLYAVPQNIHGVGLVYSKALKGTSPATNELLAIAAQIGATEGMYGLGFFPQRRAVGCAGRRRRPTQ